MEVGGIGMFSLELRVLDPALLADPEGAEVHHEFARVGTTGAAIGARVSAFAAWLAGQPDEAFVGPRGRDLCVVVLLRVVPGEYESSEPDEVWGHLTLPTALMAECVRRDLPIRVRVESWF